VKRTVANDVDRLMKMAHVAANVQVTLIENYMPGRAGFNSGVRPNHIYPGVDYACAGILDFVDRDQLAPGETCAAKARLMIPEKDVPLFAPGFKWHICESNTIVGFAELLSVTSVKGIT